MQIDQDKLINVLYVSLLFLWKLYESYDERQQAMIGNPSISFT